MGIKVKSTKMCFYHGRRYRPGEVFELADKVKPSADMTVVDDDAPAKKERREKEPSTFSEISKQL